MSGQLPYVMANKARQDILDIEFRSIKEWGRVRAARYLKDIHKKCVSICSFPDIGHKMEDIPSSIRSIISESHVIFYEIYRSEVHVLRILHKNMDFTNDELFAMSSAQIA